MPQLKKIVVQNFRNISLAEIEFSAKLNCVSGDNGQGKTNLLDAIYYLSMTKTPFDNTDKYNFRNGSAEFGICGQYVMPSSDLPAQFSIKVSQTDKTIKRDDKTYGKISEHIGVLPVVMVSPGDIGLVSESTELRRKFVNSVLSQMDREYLSDLQRYNRVLSQRNVALKVDAPSDDYLDVLDGQLDLYAQRIFQKRGAFIETLRPVVEKYYAQLSSNCESVGISYKSDLGSGRSLVEILKECRSRDHAFHYTTSGIQRDDFLFEMGGLPIKKVGSQGQQKSFLVALKFAQYEIMKINYGYAPMLLLDDLFDKLDINRTGNLLRMVSSQDFGQIFLTDTSKVRVQSIIRDIGSESCYYEACGGEFKIAKNEI